MLLKLFDVKSVISLPADAFYPYTSTKTSLLLAKRRQNEAPANRKEQILFARADKLGYVRKAKIEQKIPENDLVTILKDIKQHKIWNGGIQTRKTSQLSSIAEINYSETEWLTAEHQIYVNRLSNRIPLKELCVFESGTGVASPLPPYNYVEIGNTARNGVIPPELITSNTTEMIPERKKLITRLQKKIGTGDCIQYNEPVVLIPKTRTYLGRFAIVAPQDDFFFTKALHAFKPGPLITKQFPNQHTAICLLYIICKTLLFPHFIAYSRWGKVYPTLDREALEDSYVNKKETEATIAKYANKAENLHSLFETREQADQNIRKLMDRL